MKSEEVVKKVPYYIRDKYINADLFCTIFEMLDIQKYRFPKEVGKIIQKQRSLRKVATTKYDSESSPFQSFT